MADVGPIERLRTGVGGFDQVALGGLPAGRSTFIGGTTGSGKTLFAVEFLARGILLFGEPGVFITFEETAQDIRHNYASLGFPIAQWEEAGAHRVSVNSLSAVFTRFADGGLVRHEMHRIDKALTALVWLFTIDPRDGLVIIPLAFLNYPSVPASQVRVSSGITDLDQMCGGGLYKDAIVLLAGPSGAGKTLTALKFIVAGLAAGEPCLSFAFDEGREQLRRSANGWGIDLRGAEESGLLRVECDYPEVASVEDHFLRIRRAIEDLAPGRLVIDTLSALERIASPRALLDFVIAVVAVARQHGITALLTSMPAAPLTPEIRPLIAGELAGLTDVAITLSYYELAGEIQRAIAIIQTRGSAHDPRVRRATIDGDGMHIREPIPGITSVLPGAAALTFPYRSADSPGSRGPQPDG
ncbi:MAG TPA: ATPase domain-containing protein [Streptosporangiaceae bacterium]|nr:ATPase domain-containing protein [Streptosporangiaceae bacterium]